ncbi:MAG: hypothetical protein JWP37_792 [Mucilaginibacter sp.]|nr:hypothetical protein [Mucilaginibacter sp.]
MKTNNDQKKLVKLASDDPAREALGHPNGSGLLEMLAGIEDQKLEPGKNSKKPPEKPYIPVI